VRNVTLFSPCTHPIQAKHIYIITKEKTAKYIVFLLSSFVRVSEKEKKRKKKKKEEKRDT
jgi:hypothetical protein